MCLISSWLSKALKSTCRYSWIHCGSVVTGVLKCFTEMALQSLMQIPCVSSSQYELTAGHKSIIIYYDLSLAPSKIQKYWNVCKSSKPEQCTPPYVAWQNDWIACFFILKLCRFVATMTLMMSKYYPHKERDLMVTEGKQNWIYAPYKAMCGKHIVTYRVSEQNHVSCFLRFSTGGV